MAEKQELQGIIGELVEKLSDIQGETERNRLLSDDRFRSKVTSLLDRLDISIDGHPENIFHIVDEIKSMLLDHRNHYDIEIKNIADEIGNIKKGFEEISKENTKILDIKEEQLPKWVTKLIVILVSGIGMATTGAVLAWWSLSNIARILPQILNILEHYCPKP